MKPSQIFSTLAALCIFVTLVAAPSINRNAGNESTTPAAKTADRSEVTYTAADLPLIVVTATLPKNEPAVDESDFEYLRFDANKYAEADVESVSELPEQLPAADNTFDYLKFSVQDYINESSTNPDSIEMPLAPVETDFGYLKFRVSDYTNLPEE